MLVSGSLRGLSIFFFLHLGPLLFGELGVGLARFILFDVLLFLGRVELPGVLAVLAGTGGGFAFGFAHLLKACF